MCQQSDYETIQIWNTCASSQHGALQRFIKMNTHTRTLKKSWEQWQTEWAQTPNSVFHLSFHTSGCKIHHYYVVFPLKADPSECKLVWVAVHTPWVYREMEHSFRAKTDEVCVCVVLVHLSDLRQGYLWEQKIIRIIHYQKKKALLSLSPMILIYTKHKAFHEARPPSFTSKLEKLANLHLCQKTKQGNW